jgi:hypothetical protein
MSQHTIINENNQQVTRPNLASLVPIGTSVPRRNKEDSTVAQVVTNTQSIIKENFNTTTHEKATRHATQQLTRQHNK